MRSTSLLALTIAAAASAQPSNSVEGYWRNPIGSAIIAIAPCGNSLCGKVVWASPRGQREVSKNAPNVVGTTVLTGLRPAGMHWAGSLYIPDDDIHVSARLQPLGGGKMKLTGCAFIGLFCRAQIWTRADRLPPSNG
jgi:uncharacterized protein (DUF2147 family)